MIYHTKGEVSFQSKTFNRIENKFHSQTFFDMSELITLSQAIKKSKTKIFTLKANSKPPRLPHGVHIAHHLDLNSQSFYILLNLEENSSANIELQKKVESLQRVLEYGKNKIYQLIKNDIYYLNTLIEDSLGCLLNNEINLNREDQKIQQADNSLHQFHVERVSLLGELLNTLQHELSNPLFGIQLSSRILSMSDFHGAENPDECLDIVKNIQESAERSLETIKNMTKIFDDKKIETISNYSRNELLSFIRHTILLTKSSTKHIQFSIDESNFLLSDDQLSMSFNEGIFIEIIFNFIMNGTDSINQKKNSSDNSLRGHIHIMISTDPIRNEVLISVEDNGHGILPQVANTISTPFVTTKTFGHGLGLSICRSLAEKMNASITFSNILDNELHPQGARFILHLPFRKKE